MLQRGLKPGRSAMVPAGKTEVVERAAVTLF
jgi:hypothetical protein